MKYKRSQFNYVSRSKDGYLIYNTLYNSLTRITEAEFGHYIDPDMNNGEIEQQLASQGILVDESIDERKNYNIYSRLTSKYLQERPHLTVTPTMECNARCFYCYENGVRCGKMKSEDADAIIRAIKALDISQGIDITWFGGEPLMAQEWMDYFAGRLREEGIEFSGFIISNGSLIDKETIEKMKNVWNVESIQITLDGSIDEYASRKSYIDRDENVYYQIFRNISRLSRAGISVNIRLNIDRANRDSILEAAEDIAQMFKENLNVSCYPAFLSGSAEPLSEREKIDFIKKLLEVCETNFRAQDYLYKLPRTMACYYYQKNAFSIDANGDIFTCEHLLGHKESSIGNISEDSPLQDRERELSGRRSECQSCLFLPKCHGGCADLRNNGELPCFIDKYIIKAYLELL